MLICLISFEQEPEFTDYLRQSGYLEESDLVEYHVNLTGTRTTDQMETERAAFKKIPSLKKRFAQNPLIPTFENYKARIDHVKQGNYYLHDPRILWFYDEFLKLVGDCKVIVCYNAIDITDKVIDKKTGDTVLIIDAFDEKAVNEFLSLKAKPKVETDVSE